MKNSRTLFISILAAATAGVVIGMLIAPEKGEDLRKNIKGAAGDFTKKLADLIAEGKQQFNQLASSVADGVQEVKDEVKGSKGA